MNPEKKGPKTTWQNSNVVEFATTTVYINSEISFTHKWRKHSKNIY